MTPKSLSYLLKKRPPLNQIKQIHAKIITSACSSKVFLFDSLIHCYLNINNLSSARILFNQYPLSSPSTLLWNIMIRAYSKLQNSPESMNLFRRMISFRHPSSGFLPDPYTFSFVITSCAHQMSVLYGEIVHGIVMRTGCGANLYVSNCLINMYAGFERMDDAQNVFNEMSERDVFSWTSLVRGYARIGQMNCARRIFCEMPERNEVSWTVMISGFVGNGRYVEALRYFREMLGGNDHKLRPNEAVLVCALSACAHLGALDQGNWIQAYMDKNDIFLTSNIRTSLIDMYAKCGKINCARRLFYEIPQPDVHNFTSFITGLSIYGLGTDALCVFNYMLANNVKPNEVTVLGVLNGCSHSGLVEEGSAIFNTMESTLGIVPEIQHYGCYTDLLGRAGYLEKAFAVVKSMPMKPDLAIWRALLNACRIHQNVNLGEHIINHMKQLEPCGRSGGEVLLSNLYASLGKWESVTEVREMGQRDNHSDVGASWIEVNGVVHEFRVADKLHPQIVEIRKKLQEILERASAIGYVISTSQVSFDLSEEEKVQAVEWHSEKLAIAFGLISTTPGISIRIVKNLRTCEDCHSALKAISRVYEREIIVRDRSRFHVFREGNCSCQDYW